MYMCIHIHMAYMNKFVEYIYIYNFSKYTQIVFPNGCTITLLSAVYDNFRCSTFLSTLAIVSPSNFSHDIISITDRGQ